MFRAACSGMLVFGERRRSECPRQLLQELQAAAARPIEGRADWIDRHGRLVDLFIAAAGLAQGLLDERFARERRDRLDATVTTVDAVLRRLAGSVIDSWTTGATPSPAVTTGAIAALATLQLPERVESKEAEGYAYYALYPESYAMAARGLAGTSPTVIGLRSIGLGLGAVVAAGTGASLSLSLRPIGHPFERKLALANGLRDSLAGRRDRLFAVVDEGPGLSGSSFAAVADVLERLGVPRRNIHFFPSHHNPPGGAARPETVARWHAAPRHVVGFDRLALDTPEPRHRLAAWVEDLTGPALVPLQDIGAGRWRELSSTGRVAPASPQKERRKFLLRGERGVFLLRFAGLGRTGRAALRRARILAGSGFTIEPLGLRHGFLVERWQEEAGALDANRDRAGLVVQLADYLAFRARHLPAPAQSGATLAELDEMRRRNIAGLLASAAHEARLPAPPPEHLVRRVETDNRMHAWEWLLRPGGRLVKTDAIDHCDAHDLIGCQDIAWDVVGAGIELGLSDGEFDALCAGLRSRGCALEPRLIDFYESCYLAFQAGNFTLDAQAPLLEVDRRLLCTLTYRYVALLKKRCLREL